VDGKRSRFFSVKRDSLVIGTPRIRTVKILSQYNFGNAEFEIEIRNRVEPTEVERARDAKFAASNGSPDG
jgi:hypothetical protein